MRKISVFVLLLVCVSIFSGCYRMRYYSHIRKEMDFFTIEKIKKMTVIQKERALMNMIGVYKSPFFNDLLDPERNFFLLSIQYLYNTLALIHYKRYGLRMAMPYLKYSCILASDIKNQRWVDFTSRYELKSSCRDYILKRLKLLEQRTNNLLKKFKKSKKRKSFNGPSIEI